MLLYMISLIWVVAFANADPSASTVPSQVPYSSGLWSLEPFYLAVAGNQTPNNVQVQALAYATEDYVNLKFKEIYGPKFSQSYISLTNVRLFYEFPTYEFNLLMEFSISVSFYSGMSAGPPIPSTTENFQALKDILTDETFLTQIVRTKDSFSSSTAVAADLASLIKAPSIIPSSVPGSIVPSQVPGTTMPSPSPMESTVPSQIPYSSGLWSLEPFYLAIAHGYTYPTNVQVQALAYATEDYVNLKFKEIYGPKFSQSYISLTNVRTYYEFPSYEFNLLMEFSISVSFYSGMSAGPPIPSTTENFQALQDILTSDATFLTQIVRTKQPFSGSTAVAADRASLIKAPSIVPSSVPGSIVPSQVPGTTMPSPSPMESTVPSLIPYSSGLWSLEPFYLAIALPSTTNPTSSEISALAYATEDYVNLKFQDMYAPKYNGGYVSLQKFRFGVKFPSAEFHLLMEFSVSVAFFSGMPAGPPIPSEAENFQALKDVLSGDTDFLSQIQSKPGFAQASAVAVDAASLITTLSPTLSPTPDTCSCPTSVTSIANSLAQAQSAVRIWVQYDTTTFLKATDGYLYYQAYASKWYKNGDAYGDGKIILKTHSATDTSQCGQPLVETKKFYIVFGTVATEKIPGFAGPTTVLSFDSCSPPQLAASLTNGEWRTLYKDI